MNFNDRGLSSMQCRTKLTKICLIRAYSKILMHVESNGVKHVPWVTTIETLGLGRLFDQKNWEGYRLRWPSSLIFVLLAFSLSILVLKIYHEWKPRTTGRRTANHNSANTECGAKKGVRTGLTFTRLHLKNISCFAVYSVSIT
jgi:hypothetical protein